MNYNPIAYEEGMNTMVGKSVMEHLFKLPCSKADQQEEVRKCSFTKVQQSHEKKFYTILYGFGLYCYNIRVQFIKDDENNRQSTNDL